MDISASGVLKSAPVEKVTATTVALVVEDVGNEEKVVGEISSG